MPLLYNAPPSAAYLLGLLADLERAHTLLQAQLTHALRQTSASEPQWAVTQAALAAQTAAVRSQQVVANDAARQLATGNARLAALHQEVGHLTRRLDELRNRMQAMGDTDAFRQLRRSRATIGVQLEDRKKELAEVLQRAQTTRANLETARTAIVAQNDASREVRGQLVQLQRSQPPAQLYLDLFANTAARAHAQLLLETAELKDVRGGAGQGVIRAALPVYAEASATAWRASLQTAVAYVTDVYAALRRGRYDAEAATSWAGGRAVAVSESLYGLVAMGDFTAAIDLFSQTSAPDTFFHHIFQTFRGGCLGLFLVGRHAELAEVLRLHQLTPGVRGAYAEAFWALLRGEADAFNDSLVQLAIGEWRLWQKSPTPGLGLVNLSVLGLVQLGQLRGFRVPHTFGPTVPHHVLPR